LPCSGGRGERTKRSRRKRSGKRLKCPGPWSDADLVHGFGRLEQDILNDQRHESDEKHRVSWRALWRILLGFIMGRAGVAADKHDEVLC